MPARDQDECVRVQCRFVSLGATIMSSGVGAISGIHRPDS